MIKFLETTKEVFRVIGFLIILPGICLKDWLCGTDTWVYTPPKYWDQPSPESPRVVIDGPTEKNRAR
jgi:hypothetical protein